MHFGSLGRCRPIVRTYLLDRKRQQQTVLTAWLVEILPRVVGYHL